MNAVEETLRKLERAKAQAQAAQGALGVHMEALRALGYDSLEAAQAALVEQEQQAARDEAAFAAALAEFRSKWGHLVQV